MTRRNPGIPESAAATLSSVESVKGKRDVNDSEDDELERVWRLVEAGLNKILNVIDSRGNFDVDDVRRRSKKLKVLTPNEWVFIYSEVAKVYRSKSGNARRQLILYCRTEKFIRDSVIKWRDSLKNLSGLALLKEYMRCWFVGTAASNVMNRLLGQMTDLHVEPSKRKGVKAVCKMNLLFVMFWKEELLEKLPEVVNNVLDVVDDRRRGTKINITLLRQVISTIRCVGEVDVVPFFEDQNAHGWQQIGYYKAVFEKRYFERTRHFIQCETEKKLRRKDVLTFMESAKSRLQDEISIAGQVLHGSSVGRLLALVNEELVEKHRSYLEEEVEGLINRGCKRGLSLHYNLMLGIENGLSSVTRYFRKRIYEEGLTILDQERSPEGVEEKNILHVIDKLIALHRRYAWVIKKCFCGEQCFINSLRETFRDLLSKTHLGMTMPHLLITYADRFLRCAVPEALSLPNDDARHDDIFGKVLTRQVDGFFLLFLCLERKESFSDLYALFLAKRLLHYNYNDLLERQVIELLQLQLGPSKTQNLVEMLEDAGRFEDLNKQFQKTRDLVNSPPKSNSSIDFTTKVLRSSCCLSFNCLNPVLPSSVGRYVSEFDQFYAKRYKDRKLTWCHEEASAMVEFSVKDKCYHLHVSGVQACALVHFNKEPEIDSVRLACLLGLKESIVDNSLAPLVHRGILKVKKRTSDPGQKEATVYQNNDDFVSNARSIFFRPENKISTAPRAKFVQKYVELDRECEVDCTVVRLLKAEKKMLHDDLVAKVCERLAAKFAPKANLVMERIENCIKQDFLKRDEDNPRMYHYVP